MEARALTYEEHEELIEAGLDPAFQKDEERQMGSKWVRSLIKWVLPKIYPELDYKKLPAPVVRKLALDTYILTMKDIDEIKNS